MNDLFTPDTQKPIDKVRKLMDMAEGGTPAEQAIAMRKAQRLMEQYQISSTDLVLSKVKEMRVRISNSHRPKQYVTHLVIVVTEAFGARTWMQSKLSEKYKPITEVVLIGFEPHIEVAQYVLQYLIYRLNHDMKIYQQRMKAERKRQRKAPLKSKTIKSRLDSFAMGWVIKVAEQLPAAITQSPVQSGGKELIPVNILDEYKAKQGAMGTYRAKSVTLNAHTYNGEQAGSKVTVRAGVDGTSHRSMKRLH